MLSFAAWHHAGDMTHSEVLNQSATATVAGLTSSKNLKHILHGKGCLTCPPYFLARGSKINGTIQNKRKTRLRSLKNSPLWKNQTSNANWNICPGSVFEKAPYCRRHCNRHTPPWTLSAVADLNLLKQRKADSMHAILIADLRQLSPDV